MKRIATLRILLSLCFGLAACGIYVPRIITNVPITPKRKWLSPPRPSYVRDEVQVDGHQLQSNRSWAA